MGVCLDDSTRSTLLDFVAQFQPSRDAAEDVIIKVGLKHLFELLLAVDSRPDEIELIAGAVERLLRFPDINAELFKDEHLCALLISEGRQSRLVTIRVLLVSSLLLALKSRPPLIPLSLIPLLIASFAILLKDSEISVAQTSALCILELIQSGLVTLPALSSVLRQCIPTTGTGESAESMIRGLDLALRISELNERSFEWVKAEGFLDSLITLCASSDDLLLQLSALELLERLSQDERGIAWMLTLDQSTVNVPELLLRNALENSLIEESLATGFLRAYESLLEASPQPEQLALPLAPHIAKLMSSDRNQETLRIYSALRLITSLSKRAPTVLVALASESLATTVELGTSVSTPGPLRNSALEALTHSVPSLISSLQTEEQRINFLPIEKTLTLRVLRIVTNPASLVDSRSHLFRLLSVLFESLPSFRQIACADTTFRNMLVDKEIDSEKDVSLQKLNFIRVLVEHTDQSVLLTLGGSSFVDFLQSIVDAMGH